MQNYQNARNEWIGLDSDRSAWCDLAKRIWDAHRSAEWEQPRDVIPLGVWFGGGQIAIIPGREWYPRELAQAYFWLGAEADLTHNHGAR